MVDSTVAQTPFNLVDEAVMHVDDPAAPWSVAVEARVRNRLEPDRLRVAVASAMRRHPMARARLSFWRASDSGYQWEIPSTFDVDPLYVVECRGGDSLSELRQKVHSLWIPLEQSPPFRVVLAKATGGDVVMLNVNHTASDAMGSMRILASILRAYAGDPDPVPDVDPLSVRDLSRELAPRAAEEGLECANALIGKLRDSARPATRVAADGGEQVAGYHFHHQILDAAQTATVFSRRRGDATVNDVLLAAMHRAIDLWNLEHDVKSERIGSMMPVNVRPRSRWHEIVGNFALGMTISTTPDQRRSFDEALAAITSQSRRLKRPGSAASLLVLLKGSERMSISMKRRLAGLISATADAFVDTTVVSNLGDLTPMFSVTDPRLSVSELWFSTPCRMPMGLSLGVASMNGCIHLAFRGSPELLSATAVRRFARMYCAELVGATIHPNASSEALISGSSGLGASYVG